MTQLQEILLKVLINNVNTQTLNEYKQIVFDIATNERQSIQLDLDMSTEVGVETHVRSANGVKEFCEKYLISGIDYEATYNLNINKEDYFYIRANIPAIVTGVNIYNVNPYTIAYETKNGWETKQGKSINEFKKSNITQLVRIDLPKAPEEVELKDVI